MYFALRFPTQPVDTVAQPELLATASVPITSLNPSLVRVMLFSMLQPVFAPTQPFTLPTPSMRLVAKTNYELMGQTRYAGAAGEAGSSSGGWKPPTGWLQVSRRAFFSAFEQH